LNLVQEKRRLRRKGDQKKNLAIPKGSIQSVPKNLCHLRVRREELLVLGIRKVALLQVGPQLLDEFGS
jgi:hypothetical protein